MNNKNNQVQGLRGLSCILILIFHFTYRYCQIYVVDFRAWDYFRVLSGLGVATFCILSGYYIAKDKRSGKFFIINRVKKVYPAYSLIVIISFIIVSFFKLPYRSVKVTDLVLNLLCLNGYLQKPYVDGAHWYITTLLSVVVIWGGYFV